MNMAFPSSWKTAAIALIAAISAALALNIDVVGFTIHTWETNETYTHGFLIFPISAWLIWRKRHIVAAMSPALEPRGIFPILFLCLAWQMGHQAGAMVVQQYCLIGLICASAWTFLGTKVFNQLSFPLLFLLLAVPVGEALIPTLMNFTADFTVGALQWTGIPVYKEGTFFSLPDGNWSVIEACSGLRYLISSLTLGILYAYLTYRSLTRKLVFIAFSAAVPVLANGIRAYMIVMIGHLSGMQLAKGIDHLIYGWVFFGIVMLLLFWIGSFFRENEQDSGYPEEKQESRTDSPPPAAFVAASAIVVAIILSNAAYAEYLDRKLRMPARIDLNLSVDSGWQENPAQGWIPHYLGSRRTLVKHYIRDGENISVFVAFYRDQHQGAELITSGNMLVESRDSLWENVGEKTIDVAVGSEKFNIIQAVLKSGEQRLLAWKWYWVDGRWTINPYIAKLLEAKSRILSGNDDAAVIVLSTPDFNTRRQTSEQLKDFLNQELPRIETMLRHAVKRD